MRRRTVLALAFLLMLTAAKVCAQGGNQTSSRLFSPDSNVGDLEGAVLTDLSAVTVSIGEDEETASILFVKPWMRHKLSAKISAPVDEDSRQADFVGVDGLNGAASMKVEYNHVNWPEHPLYELFSDAEPGSFPGAELIDQDLEREMLKCVYNAERLRVARQAAAGGAFWSVEREERYAKLQKVDLPTRGEIVDYLRAYPAGGSPLARNKLEEEADRKVAELEKMVQLNGLCSSLAEFAGELKDQDPQFKTAQALFAAGLASRQEIMGRRRVALWGFNGTVGQKKFTYLDRGPLEAAGTIEEASDRELPWSVGVRGGWIFLSNSRESQGEESLIFSVNLDRGYKAADGVDLCKPVEGLESVHEIADCKEVALGGPRPLDSVRYVAEYRFLAKHLGVAIRGFYEGSDEESDDWGLETPFYFVPNADGDFQGGVTVGWREEERDVSIAVFVGRKFEIF